MVNTGGAVLAAWPLSHADHDQQQCSVVCIVEKYIF
jgi:hypothetical protein